LAKQVQTLLVDDLDGSPADVTLKFALDGKQYEIDLSQANAIRFDEAVDEFVTAARRASRPGSKPAQVSNGRRPKEQTKAIRRWLRERGEQVSDRGRIPHQLVELFDKEAGRA
jgi:hypothetical protein